MHIHRAMSFLLYRINTRFSYVLLNDLLSFSSHSYDSVLLFKPLFHQYFCSMFYSQHVLKSKNLGNRSATAVVLNHWVIAHGQILIHETFFTRPHRNNKLITVICKSIGALNPILQKALELMYQSLVQITLFNQRTTLLHRIQFWILSKLLICI